MQLPRYKNALRVIMQILWDPSDIEYVLIKKRFPSDTLPANSPNWKFIDWKCYPFVEQCMDMVEAMSLHQTREWQAYYQ